ncbi:MAG: CDP-6-deoxy-delta-3,4-glucoseen reductase [Gammaproteobacteria bacterium]|nr:CDP-6-deoxy-delta-3,4-glucoseen reductase [Gammaproteobacteria bacterium]
MKYTIKVEPSGHVFEVNEGEKILDAALRQGFAFPYSCRGGACGSCKGKIVEGDVEYVDREPRALSEYDKQTGMALFCQARPTADMVIEMREISAAKDIQIKILPCRVSKMERLAHDVMRLYLKLPQVERVQFLAGQYLDILLPGGRRRSFSLANPPHDDELLELHIRRVEGGEYTQHIFEKMKEKDLLRIELPLGNFYLREDSGRPIILMAGGTGFAPIKAIIEHAIAEKTSRKIFLYWGVRDKASLYLPDLPQQWAAQHDNISFIPVLSEPKPEDSWQGRTGYVHQAIAEDFSDLSDYEIYACGPPVMIESGQTTFAGMGLKDDNFYSDAFNYAGDTPTA